MTATKTSIPQAFPGARFARYRDELDAAIQRVLDSNRYILGPEVEAFESRFARYLGAANCVGVGNGTDAIRIALRALGIGPGDEVITTALTAAGTAQGILESGATVRFVDVDPISRCLAPAAVQVAITARTAALVPVHLFGIPADMPALMAIARRNGLVVLEDCAQAHGAVLDGKKLGSFGDAAAFSFYPTKNLGAIGDGGAVVCNDPMLAARARRLRNHGWGENPISQEIAGNSRLDELQAAFLSVMLGHLDDGNRERQAVATRYHEALKDKDIGLPFSPPGSVHHQFAITSADREALRQGLAEDFQIGTTVHYAPPLHRQPAFQGMAVAELPITEDLARSLLSLPIQPEIVEPNADYIINGIHQGILQCRAS